MPQSKEERNAKAREAYARRKVSTVLTPASAKQSSKPKLKVSVASLWISVLHDAVGKNLSDDAIALTLSKALPDRTPYLAEDVARHRTLYNHGRIKGQTSVPSKKLERTVANA